MRQTSAAVALILLGLTSGGAAPVTADKETETITELIRRSFADARCGFITSETATMLLAALVDKACSETALFRCEAGNDRAALMAHDMLEATNRSIQEGEAEATDAFCRNRFLRERDDLRLSKLTYNIFIQDQLARTRHAQASQPQSAQQQAQPKPNPSPSPSP